MNSKDFCNWLSGYLEVANPAHIGAKEIAMIREHLELARKTDFQKTQAANYVYEGKSVNLFC